MTRRDDRAAARALARARAARVPRRAAEETALMLMLYAGYPCALEALRVLNNAWPGRARRAHEGGVDRWRRQGERLCRRVYGPVYRRLLASVRGLHPDLAVWMEEQGYGRVLARPGLRARARELITVAALAALGWERQLVSHLIGAKRLGAAAAAVRAAWQCGVRGAGATERAAARRAWVAAQGAYGATARETRRRRAG